MRKPKIKVKTKYPNIEKVDLFSCLFDVDKKSEGMWLVVKGRSWFHVEFMSTIRVF